MGSRSSDICFRYKLILPQRHGNDEALSARWVVISGLYELKWDVIHFGR